MNQRKTFLVTGAAGFIGFYLAKRLLEENFEVIGIDNLNDYYDVSLKESRLALLKKFPEFQFFKMDIADRESLFSLFKEKKFDGVLHMAAQAGVRYSLQSPEVYIQSNLVGFANLLEAMRQFPSGPLFYASSSSVYGANTKQPFSVGDCVEQPVSLYAATKKSNELMAHCYSHLYGLTAVGLRFFTVYGPWGRPDMALFLFTKAILNGEALSVFHEGQMRRDFTYIDDAVDAVFSLLNSTKPLKAIYNIGSGRPILLTDFITAVEEVLDKKGKKKFLPLQPGDVLETFADIRELKEEFGWSPKTPLKEGVEKFVEWYKMYRLHSA